jgi:uncharacterized protein (TIGR01777 family)
MERFIKSTRIERPAEDVFAWHERPGVLERLIPPWERVEVIAQRGGLRAGGSAVVRLKIGPWWVRWEADHDDRFVEGRRFCDVQRKGPFAAWEHIHGVDPEGLGACRLTDDVGYLLPGGALGRLIANRMVREKLHRTFSYRHATTAADLGLAVRYGSVRPLRILVSGASGLVGSALVPFLQSQGHQIVRLVRRPAVQADEIAWDARRELDPLQLRGVEAVIHLAGEGIASGRWTEVRREAIRSTRIESTRALVNTMAAMKQKPFVFACASAIGFYGPHPTLDCDEAAPQGTGFLADVCAAWESEAAVAQSLGIRTAMLRTGLVLTPAGGMLGKLLPIFSAGLGGPIGGGRQWMSWIGRDDLIGAYYHALLDQRCVGPLNAVAPEAVVNAEFARVLGRVLGRPAVFPVPAWALRAALGNMAEETVLAGARVRPNRLVQSGYEFRHERLEPALRHALGYARARQRG